MSVSGGGGGGGGVVVVVTVVGGGARSLVNALLPRALAGTSG